MQEKIKEVLRHFSLTDQEIDIYFTVLSLKFPTVADIAKRVGLNRTTVYFHLPHLLEKGILKESRQGKVKTYVATPASELASSLQRLVVDFKGFVPFLESAAMLESEKPIIEMVESREGYLKVYDAIASLPPGSFFRVMEGETSWELEAKLFSDDTLNNFFSRLIEKNIETRALFTKESLQRIKSIITDENYTLMSKRKMQLKTIGENIFPITDMMLIYGNKVSFMFPKTSMVLTITHKSLVNFLGVFFDGFFALAEEVENPWEQ